MNAKVSVLFYAKKSKTKSNLRVPIYLRITVNGKRAEFSTGKDVEISKWSSAQNRLTQITQLKFFEISLWGNPKFRRTIFCVFW